MEKINGTISTVIIARNEEQGIQKCLSHLTWATEIILVDNNSTDNTVTRAKPYHVRVIKSSSNDFSELRSVGMEAASCDWILYIDVDEIIGKDLHDEIIKTTESYIPGQSPVAYFIYRKNYYLGHEWPFKDKLIRLIKRDALKGWVGKVHESAKIEGNIGELHESLVHDTHRSLEEMVQKTNEWSQTEAELRYKAGHPPIVWWRFPRVMVTTFIEYYFRQGGWKVGTIGWVESVYQAFSIFITYAKLWELQKTKKIKN